MSTDLSFDPVRAGSLALAIITLITLIIAAARMRDRFIPVYLSIYLLHIIVFYSALILARISFTTPLPNEFTNWSSALRLHGVSVILAVAIYLAKYAPRRDRIASKH